ncbi:MAG: flagellar basal-body MS-ring/collar protein FliF [Pseudolabrys sp.]|nr:flagellar basal-body MS-ring/collar protein FliF [Pseudolabrys sp.]MDP2298545.1 flagellar basal-body MS-ring/collar protein FliF [Pseudolabrys sp.]
MQGFFDFVKSLGAARMAAMAAVTLALIGFFTFLMIQMNTPTMVPLFTDLSVEDSSAIIKDLERQAIDYQIKNDGAIVMVPKDKVARLRMKLAESGLPKGGGVGYEIFDKSDALGATSFIQNINHLRALEGELARSIRGLDRVSAARVHLVLPERPLFSRDKVAASASIVLKVRGALEPQQVRAIRHLVATAVNGMKPERVSVIDETGRLLADGSAQENNMSGVSADERKTAYENRLRDQVEAIVSSVVGPGKARVQLNADFDLNRVTQTSDKFDPDGRVVRSSQTREEQSNSQDGKEGGPVSVAGELPGSNKDGSSAGGGQRDQSKKTEEIVNYEISRTTKTEVIEAGRVNRISAAVLVDGRYVKDPKGEMVYQPRAKEEIDRIAALVRTAIGFDAKRGDQIEVVNLRFADTGAPISAGESLGWMKYFQFTKDDIMGAAEKGVMALLGLIVLLMVVRPLVRRVVTPENPALGKAGMAGMAGVAGALGSGGQFGPDGQPLNGGGNGDSLTNTSGTNIAIVGGEDTVAISNRTSAMIDVAKVQGQVHAQSVQKVGELAEKNPHEAVSVIRSWLHEDAA